MPAPSRSTSPQWPRLLLLALVIVALLSTLALLRRNRQRPWHPLPLKGSGSVDKTKSGLYQGTEPPNASEDLEHTHNTSVAETQAPTEEPTQNDSVEVQNCTVDQDVQVLGRVLDRCATLEAARLVVEEDIYVSVKTTQKYHDKRVLPSLQTWFQTVPADRIHVITDGALKEDTLYQMAKKTGIDIVFTDCPQRHSAAGLCCKSRNEYFRYFNTTTKTGDLHKWYCHFDDDMYVNIPALVKGLREALSKSEDGGVYYGRWPREKVSRSNPNGYTVSAEKLKELGYNMGVDLTAKWATGAAYCLTSTVMKKIKEILTKNTYETYCNKFGVSDDVTAAMLIGMAGYYLSNDDKIRTQYDLGRHKPLPPNVGFEELITVSYTLYPNKLKDDPSRFLAYHCLLYPPTSWCQK